MTVTMPVGQRLTPDEVRVAVFQPARLGHRGLDQGQVQAFRVKVEQELTLLLEEKASLQLEIERLHKPTPGGSDNGASAEVRPEDAHVHAVRILAKAQQTADRYVADAQEYSRELAENARRRRDEIVDEAKAGAAMVLEQAHSDARAAAGAVAAPTEPLSAAELQKVQAELAYLRTFSDVCRTHLRAYLEAVLRNVDEWERMEKNPLASAKTEPPSHQPRRNHQARR